jgi:hypothetical protein
VCWTCIAQDDLWEFILAEATKKDIRCIIENKSKFVRCHCTSGHKYTSFAILVLVLIIDRHQHAKIHLWLLRSHTYFEFFLFGLCSLNRVSSFFFLLSLTRRGALKEVLADPAVAGKIATTHAMDEVKALNTFLEMLDTVCREACCSHGLVCFALLFLPLTYHRLLFSSTVFLAQDANRAFYGFKHVKLANDNRAINTLLITDALFRYRPLP